MSLCNTLESCHLVCCDTNQSLESRRDIRRHMERVKFMAYTGWSVSPVERAVLSADYMLHHCQPHGVRPVKRVRHNETRCFTFSRVRVQSHAACRVALRAVGCSALLGFHRSSVRWMLPAVSGYFEPC